MILEQTTQDDVLVLRPVGRLDSNSSPELERAVLEHLEKGCKRLVFDLSDMDYVSSAGLRVILLTGKKLRASQGKLALDPAVGKRLLDNIKRTVGDLEASSQKPVLLTSMDIRRYIRKMIEQDLYDLPVLSYHELTQEINIQPLARIDL